ncbi:MAG: hypothetical protein WDW38_005689 [Sanguina aurantia]
MGVASPGEGLDRTPCERSGAALVWGGAGPHGGGAPGVGHTPPDAGEDGGGISPAGLAAAAGLKHPGPPQGGASWPATATRDRVLTRTRVRLRAHVGGGMKCLVPVLVKLRRLVGTDAAGAPAPAAAAHDAAAGGGGGGGGGGGAVAGVLVAGSGACDKGDNVDIGGGGSDEEKCPHYSQDLFSAFRARP